MFDNFTFKEATFDCVPEGSYTAEHVGIEEVNSKYEKDGKAIAWRFKIINGKENGKIVSLVSGKTPTPKNKCGKTITALLDRTPANGETVNVKDCIGKKYHIRIVKNDNGEGTKVDTIMSVPS